MRRLKAGLLCSKCPALSLNLCSSGSRCLALRRDIRKENDERTTLNFAPLFPPHIRREEGQGGRTHRKAALGLLLGGEGVLADLVLGALRLDDGINLVLVNVVLSVRIVIVLLGLFGGKTGLALRAT